MSNEISNPVWRAVLRIPSRDLALIQSENDLLAAYKRLVQSVYNFAAEVNKICVKFLKENSLFEFQPSSTFKDFNSKILEYFQSLHPLSEPVLFSEKNYFENTDYRKNIFSNLRNLKTLRLGTDDEYADFSDYWNVLSPLYELFLDASDFYNKICLPYASLQLHKQYEKLQSYFNEPSFEVFAVFDLKPYYLIDCDEQLFLENWENNFESWKHDDFLRRGMGSEPGEPMLYVKLESNIPTKNISFFIEDENSNFCEHLLSEIIRKHIDDANII
jgi:hypothetical protein